jgi:predicted hotdog family 3-hydroxylacyl-ACP dehydratase
MSDFPPVAELVPHREPMVLLDQILRWEVGEVECAMTVREGARFVEDGALLAPFTIEHMAQAVAVCLGYEAYRGGRGIRVGMIVSCREFRAHRVQAAVGDELRVHALRDLGNESVSHFQCEVQHGSELFSSATLTLFHGETLIEGAV